MKERPILIAVIGYIIGILWGLYLKISIALFYILSFAIIYIIYKKFVKNKKKQFKLISLSRYSRYLKLIINTKVILILIIFSNLSNILIFYKNNQYENLYFDGQNVKITGIVISSKIEKSYFNLYKNDK